MARVRIDELVELRGISAYRLAKDSGINHATIAKLKYGKAKEIRLDVIDRLCAVLECDAGELIEVSKPKKGKAK
jgi:putative transcriptional regulator